MAAERTDIGRYQVRGTLGVGGFATVYRALDPTLDREVALKVLHTHLASDPSVHVRFLREGRSLARIRHPNVVQVFDAGEAGGSVYLAMELVEGHSLEAILRERGALPLDEAFAVITQLASALEAIHARDLVHRDVKPVNVIVERGTGRTVLLDLGVVRDLSGPSGATQSLIIGTPGFMAPEQVEGGGGVTPLTDVYQLGATVYSMLAGRVPFDGTPLAVIAAVVRSAPPDLYELRPDLPPGVVAAVAEAMAKDPRRRPPGAAAFAERIREGAGAGRRAVSVPLPATPTIEPRPLRDGTPVQPPPTAQSVSLVSQPTGGGLPPAGGPALDPGDLPTIRTDPLPLPPGPLIPPLTPARRRVLPLILALVVLAATVAVGGVLLARRDAGDRTSATLTATISTTLPPSPSLPTTPTVAATPSVTPAPTVSPTPAATATATAPPTRTASPTRTPAPTATRTTTTPPSATASATPDSPRAIAALMTQTMARAGYSPAGPIVQTPVTGGGLLSAQTGICAGSASGRCQIVFFFLGDRYLGTDTGDPSPGITALQAAGTDRIAITYANYAPADPGCCPSLPPEMVTYTWDGSRLRPSATPPGH